MRLGVKPVRLLSTFKLSVALLEMRSRLGSTGKLQMVPEIALGNAREAFGLIELQVKGMRDARTHPFIKGLIDFGVS